MAEFGILGGRDETAQFEALRQHAICHPGSTYTFAPGTDYQYTTPKWLDSVQDVTIIAYGASFENLGAGTYAYSDMDSAVVLGSGSIFHDSQGTGQLDPAKAQNGDLVQDINVGDTDIDFVAASDSDHYAVGDLVLLRWFDRQPGSFPPNAGFFEYVRVSAVAAGSIATEQPVAFPYKSSSPDVSAGPLYNVSEGPARALNLTRAGYKVGGTIRWHGGAGVNNGQAALPAYDGLLSVIGVTRCHIKDARFDGLLPSMAQSLDVEGSVFIGVSNEYDKLIDSVKLTRCSVNNLRQGTGVKSLSIEGGIFTGEFQMRAKQIRIRDTAIHSSFSQPGLAQIGCDQFPRTSLDVDYCTFYPKSTDDAAIQPGNVAAFIPDSVTNNTIVVSHDNPEFESVMRNVDIGSTVSLESNIAEYFTVSDLAFDENNNLTLTGNHASLPAVAGARLLWHCKLTTVGANNGVINAPSGYAFILSGNRTWELLDMSALVTNPNS